MNHEAQMPLFPNIEYVVHNPQDPARARAVTEDAIQRVEENSDDGWVEAARAAGIAAARAHALMTSDQVWEFLTDEDGNEWQPHEPSAMGPVMRWLAREGFIRRLEMDITRPSLRPSAHMKPLPLYQSLVYRGGE